MTDWLGTVANKCKMRYPKMVRSYHAPAVDTSDDLHSQFFVVLTSMVFSTIPISIIGIRFAMSVNPFWKPEQYSQSPRFLSLP